MGARTVALFLQGQILHVTLPTATQVCSFFPVRHVLFPRTAEVDHLLFFPKVFNRGHHLFQESPRTRGHKSSESDIPSLSLSFSPPTRTVILD